MKKRMGGIGEYYLNVRGMRDVTKLRRMTSNKRLWYQSLTKNQ